MSKTAKVALMLAIACSVFALATRTVSAGTDDYPSNLKNANKDSMLDSWGFENRECVSFVAWRLVHTNGFTEFNNDLTGPKGKVHLGNATGWGEAARKAGYTVNSTPAVGAVLWWPNGHVAWVESVDKNGEATIEEYNHHIYKDPGKYDVRPSPGDPLDTKAAVKTGGPQFIHFKDIKETPAAAPVGKPKAAAPAAPAANPVSSFASFIGSYSNKSSPGWMNTLTVDSNGNASYRGEGNDFPSYNQTGIYKIGTIYVAGSDYKPYKTSALIPASGNSSTSPAITNDMWIKQDTGVLVEASYYDATYPDAAVYLPSMKPFCASNASASWKQKCGL